MLLHPFPIFIIFLLTTKAASMNGEFAPKVGWQCSDHGIDILVQTKRPFHGLIQPKGAKRMSNCTFQGKGQRETQIRIPLMEGSGKNEWWKECGLHLEYTTSTLWTELELREHPQLVQSKDRLFNVSCLGWADSISNQRNSKKMDETENGHQFRLIFRSAIASSAEEMSPTNRLKFGAPYDLLLFSPLAHTAVRIHSCKASSLDGAVHVELIDSEGCSLDPELMSDFRRITKLAPPPAIISTPSSIPPNSSTTFAPSQSSSSPKTPKEDHRMVVANAHFPSMFRFNLESGTTASGPVDEFVRIECAAEPCGNEAKGQRPCHAQPNCDTRRRQFAQQNEGINDGRTQRDQPAAGTGNSREELELVTKLLGNLDEEEGGGESTAAKSSSTAENSKLNGSSPPVENSTKNIDEPMVKVKNGGGNGVGIGGGGWHRVRTMVRVFDPVKRQRAAPGWMNNSGRSNDSPQSTNQANNVPSISKDETPELTTTTMSTTSTDASSTPFLSVFPAHFADRHRIRPGVRHPNSSLSPIQRDATFIGSMPSSNQQMDSATFSPSPPPPSPFWPSSACISPEQLVRLYQICIGLCALFLLGCFCNFLLCCCLKRRSGGMNGGTKLHSPLRNKRGRRQHSVLISNGPTSNSTLSSSLYGPGNVIGQPDGSESTQIGRKSDKNSKGGRQNGDGNGFWISGGGAGEENDGREECSEINSNHQHFGPILSSIYGALPTVHPAPTSANANRRSSIHSYASVKVPHSTNRGTHQLLIGSSTNRIAPPPPTQQQQQGHELVQQGISLSPAHSPSTTTSLSDGGAASTSGHHCSSSQQQLLSRTFHPQPQQQQFGQQSKAPSSLTSSSVRSSTLGTPSPSETTEPAEASTPRPCSDLIQSQQQYGGNEHLPQNGATTFGRPMPKNFHPTMAQPMMGGQSFQNESYSIL